MNWIGYLCVWRGKEHFTVQIKKKLKKIQRYAPTKGNQMKKEKKEKKAVKEKKKKKY